MREVFNVVREDFENAGKVSSYIKKTLKLAGIETKVLRRVAIASYEAEINLVIHSNGGTITFELDEEDGKVTLSFDDIGPGIPNLDLAMQPGWSTASTEARKLGFGAGMGLVNMKRVADNFHITSSSEGTHLRMEFQ